MLGVILGGAPGFIALKNGRLAYEVVNPRFCQFLAKGAEAIIGKTDSDLFGAEEAEAAQKADKAVLQSGIPKRSEQVFTGAKGSGHFDVTRSPILDENGDPAGVLVVAHDITEYKRQSEAAAQFEAERADLVGRLEAAEAAANEAGAKLTAAEQQSAEALEAAEQRGAEAVAAIKAEGSKLAEELAQAQASLAAAQQAAEEEAARATKAEAEVATQRAAVQKLEERLHGARELAEQLQQQLYS